MEDINSTISKPDLVAMHITLHLLMTNSYSFQMYMQHLLKSMYCNIKSQQFQNVDIFKNIFSDHHGIELEINNENRKKTNC